MPAPAASTSAGLLPSQLPSLLGAVLMMQHAHYLPSGGCYPHLLNASPPLLNSAAVTPGSTAGSVLLVCSRGRGPAAYMQSLAGTLLLPCAAHLQPWSHLHTAMWRAASPCSSCPSISASVYCCGTPQLLYLRRMHRNSVCRGGQEHNTPPSGRHAHSQGGMLSVRFGYMSA